VNKDSESLSRKLCCSEHCCGVQGVVKTCEVHFDKCLLYNVVGDIDDDDDHHHRHVGCASHYAIQSVTIQNSTCSSKMVPYIIHHHNQLPM
jgi:hypothetical protein